MYMIPPIELKELFLIIFGITSFCYLIALFLGFVNRSVRTLHVAFWISIVMSVIAPNIFFLEGAITLNSWNPSILLCYLSTLAIVVPFVKWTQLQARR